MPELQHVRKLVRETYKHFQLTQALGQLMPMFPRSLSNKTM
jgi:hypothetical protein